MFTFNEFLAIFVTLPYHDRIACVHAHEAYEWQHVVRIDFEQHCRVSDRVHDIEIKINFHFIHQARELGQVCTLAHNSCVCEPSRYTAFTRPDIGSVVEVFTFRQLDRIRFIHAVNAWNGHTSVVSVGIYERVIEQILKSWIGWLWPAAARFALLLVFSQRRWYVLKHFRLVVVDKQL